MRLAFWLSGFLVLSLLGQTRDDAIERAHVAWNEFASDGNAWIRGHNDLMASRADSERLEKTRKAWKRFDSAAREAGL